MKYLLIAVTVLLSGCSCCGDEVQLPDKIETNTRWIPIRELRIDGRTLPLEMVYDGLYTAYGVLQDSISGKKVTVQAVVKTKDTTGKPLSNPSLDLSLFTPKDSVKTTDTNTTHYQQVAKSFWDGLTFLDILKGALIFFIAVFGFVFYKNLRGK